MNPQPAVQKVLDIVKAIPGGIFKSIEELDACLDDMQQQVRDGKYGRLIPALKPPHPAFASSAASAERRATASNQGRTS